jgi:serine/threonine protein kinase/tetratricopeptide (TPR) repeat protein
MSLSRGDRLGPYEILSRLGAGAMGELYLARDPRLGRELAIKVLGDESAAKLDRLRRFEEEARAASSLNHPNIVTIYDVGEENGRAFIAMELIRGQTLAERLKSGSLPESELLPIATQLGRGLARAHRSGILHRDLKPHNVMVDEDGLVKILDFGLALVHPTVDADALTVTRDAPAGGGEVAGTIPYMSPEQVLGKPLDSRSDIFSLGVVLYELATGERPFRGATAGAVFDEIVNREPPRPSEIRPGVSAPLETVIRRCLQKSAEGRYRTAEEVVADLSRGGGAAYPAARKSIAVVPFRNLSREEDTEFFADGLTEDVILDLSRVSSLRVISRASAMRLKATDKDLRTLGRELNVQYVLEGSVRKSGNRIRITAKLVDATSDEHVWGERFEGAKDDLFEIQEDMARRIVDALKLTLTPDEERRLHDRPIDDLRAHECYVRARQELWRFTGEGLERARRLIQNGLDIVGENELLFTAMGMVYWQFVNGGIDPAPENVARAVEYAEKAIAAGGRHSQTHVLNAFLRIADGDLQGAIRALRRALGVDPNDPDALYWLVVLLEFAGKGDAARPLIERLVAVDPLSPQNDALRGWDGFMDGDLAAPVEGGRRWHERDPENPLAHWMFGSILARNGRIDEAAGLFERLESNPATGAFARLGAMFRRALAGDREGTLAAVTPDLVEAAKVDWQYSWELASAYALVNAKDEAIEWLRIAIQRGFVNHRFLSNDPLLENLRGDERFIALMAEARERHESLEV